MKNVRDGSDGTVNISGGGLPIANSNAHGAAAVPSRTAEKGLVHGVDSGDYIIGVAIVIVGRRTGTRGRESGRGP